MLNYIRRFVIRNIGFFVDLIFMISTLIFFINLDKNYERYFINFYYYSIFSYIYGIIMYGIINEILCCLIQPRYPSLNNIKRIFNNLIYILSYPSPNRNLF